MFKNKNEKDKSITITREEFINTFMEVLENPFEGADIPEEDKAPLRLHMMMTGMALIRLIDEKLFGKEE